MMAGTRQTASWLTLVFILLNVADAWLTQQLLANNGVEMFWWSAHFNSNIFVKGMLALLVGTLLTRLKKVYMLKWLVTGMFLVVLSNGLCYMGYLGSLLYHLSQIATYP
jgi:hypothetical protein